MTGSTEQLTEFVRSRIPFAAQLGIEITRSGREGVEARCAFLPERCTAGGVLHGGYLMAVADTIGAVAATHHLPEGATTATIESKTNFLRAAKGPVTATATPIHVGGTTIVVQTDIRREDGSLVTRTTQSQIVLAAR